ncbi:MAG: SDR family NAD(P)-dependent oxidoreductase [Nocardioides sp.]
MGDLGYDYSGCHVVVTGGTRGSGLRVAHAFREFGATVTVTGRQYLTSYYDADLEPFRYVQLELSDPDSIVSVAESLGRVDVLVNSASAGLRPTVEDADREFIIQAVRLGLLGPLQLATRLRFRLAQSRISGGGSVVNAPNTRDWFKLSHRDGAATEFTRHTEQMGANWGSHGVRVNAILAAAPVPVTPPQQRLAVQIEAHSGPLMTRVTAPPTTSAEPHIANLALFLASRGAASLTGQTLTVR